ncbi:RagB/SusD family nutrient uptake outer membrane protein [Pedobacter jejuensis]|uniref:RagB/SusD family nutrient uptake outer membrane protein n=1 Tax=Pedobacter jejuensis TaxID=1268550 RepID=A0A3N0BPG0_9SPHI|nr:RagB/SusD family nutrient uptake outer membrane protein [Pedobacter jejuensis]RNL50742.1 RagB/SusD family nutrient uptake outer membrane protein [Pedobacter jejuensis]
MKSINIKYPSFLIMITASLMLFSCKKEYKDPNGAIAADVLASSKGLTGISVGLQRVYTVSRPGLLFNSITANGFVTNEVLLRNSGNIPELQLSTGGSAIDGTNSILLNLWTNANKIIYDADNVITNSAALADKNYAAGLIAYSSVFKAMAIGNMSQYWERVPSSIGANVSFITRVEGFNRAIAVIDNAIAVVSANPMSTTFLAQIPSGIDIMNTLYALKARYALFAGNYALALTAANLVDLTKRSSFNFDAITLNPIFEISTSTNNVFQPTDSNLGLTGAFIPDAADKRIPFYTTTSTTAPTVRINGFGAAVGTAYPIYLPGEIILIKAEVYARTPDLNNALNELNKVVTKTAATDPFGVGAALPALTGTYTQQQLLDLIYKNRCIELYMSGLKLEDMRRFNQPLTDRKRNFFPYPFQERDNNPNTPADPAF